MTNITVAIVFGGMTPEHNESIRATRILYKHAIRDKLEHKYRFRYFYISRKNRWATSRSSKEVLHDLDPDIIEYTHDRITELYRVDVIYNTMMGISGENGNIMGLADLMNIPIIGSGILGSALTLDKKLSKIVARSIGIPVVKSFCVDWRDKGLNLNTLIQQSFGYPCFVKPTNLGTCSHIFRADGEEEFLKKWRKTIRKNPHSQTYLIERYVPNEEVRVFTFEDLDGRLHTNDEYTTTLRNEALERGGTLFDHVDNKFSEETRNKIKRYARKIFRTFEMKDYARIDFFVTQDEKIYFNEANTQPFIGSYNIRLLAKDGLPFDDFIDLMIRRNID